MKSSYRQILQSTSIIGGAQVVNIVLGVARGKVLALLIGPAGVGLAGMFQSAIGLLQVFAGLGIRQAGVRQMAAASGSGQSDAVYKTARVVRLMALMSAFLGLGMVLLLRNVIARTTFGDEAYAPSIALMSLVLFFGALGGGQSALLQGLRRVRLLGLSSVSSMAAAGSISLLPVIWLGMDGIALMHVVGAAAGCAVIYFYARRVPLAVVRLPWRELWRESKALLHFGMALMGAGLVGAAVIYLTQVLIARRFDTASVGLYMSAWTLSRFYINMILSAMATDFYPRITALANDRPHLNRVVNEQIQIGALLAAPGLLFTQIFAPLMLQVLTTAEFLPATPVARWLIISSAVQALSWPMGYIMLAHGRSRLYVITETVYGVLGLVYLLVCMEVWGLAGTGIACLLISLSALCGVFVIVRHCFSFALRARTIQLGAGLLLLMGGVHVGAALLPVSWLYILGSLLVVLVSCFCLVAVQRLTGMGLLDFPKLLLGKEGTS
jgi:enterobacterial common antigen flippase